MPKTLTRCVLPLVLLLPLGVLAEALPRAATLPAQPLAAVERYAAPTVDVDALLLEDEATRGPGVPWRVGVARNVTLTPSDSGTWESFEDGSRLWRLVVSDPGAHWIRLGFSLFKLPAGAELRLVDAHGAEALGPYTAADVLEHGQLWPGPLETGELVVELYWPAMLAAEEPRLVLGSVTHGYRALRHDAAQSHAKIGESGACNIDIVCPLGANWQDEKRGVMRLLFTKDASTFVCTGSLINDTGNSCSPLVLTAHHCISTETVANTVVFDFEYENTICGVDNGTIQKRLEGADLEATWDGSDYTLLSIVPAIPESWSVYYNGWNRMNGAASEATCIHHPAGDVKKIAYSDGPLIDGAGVSPDHWRVTEWEEGTTEGGSSGSPLFDENSRIVGQLHGGVASCTNPTGWDEYGKIGSSWSQGSTGTTLGEMLDPSGSGAMTVDGLDSSQCGTPPEIRYESHTPEDDTSDVPDSIDPGETLALEIEVHNDENAQRTGVVGTLSTTTGSANHVTLVDDSADYGTVDALASKDSLAPHYTIRIDSDVDCGAELELTLSVSADGSSGSRQSTVPLVVGVSRTVRPLDDDVEAGNGNFITQELEGSNPWARSNADASSGSWSWFAADIGTRSDSVLLSAQVWDLPVGATLRFMHRYDTELDRDGGVLEYRVDGGSWLTVGAPRFLAGAPTRSIASASSPINGRSAWTGLSSGFVEARVDFSDLAGSRLEFRWRFATDDSGADYGWHVDDIVLEASKFFCDNCPVHDNPGQEDFDEDQIGDACETAVRLADADNSTRVDGFDLALLGRAFGATSADAHYDARADLDRNGLVDGDDLALLSPHYGDDTPASW